MIGAAALSGGGCVADNHPLGSQGSITFLYDSQTPIFAADVLDDSGRPVLPRQRPFRKRVQVRMLSSEAPDRGAYVDLEVNPPGSVTLVAEDGGGCEQLSGVFRCTAGGDGLASFVVRSDSDWSGEATVKVLDRAASVASATIDVLPAGLPADTATFSLTVEDLTGNSVPARFTALKCTLEPVPDRRLNKWPEGEIRVREAQIRASAPSQVPSALEHAPVIVETQSAEAFLSRTRSCPEPRDSRLRLQLDELGLSPTFYLCFSDVGDRVEIDFRAGEKRGDTVQIDVEPEPRLLRVVNVVTDVPVDFSPVPVVSVTAFNADLEVTSFEVDVRSTDSAVLQVADPVVTLPENNFQQSELAATPRSAGVASIVVTPSLYSEPACTSAPITVTD